MLFVSTQFTVLVDPAPVPEMLLLQVTVDALATPDISPTPIIDDANVNNSFRIVYFLLRNCLSGYIYNKLGKKTVIYYTKKLYNEVPTWTSIIVRTLTFVLIA
jgi:hypothetical protein